jgi:hypothetical protein
MGAAKRSGRCPGSALTDEVVDWTEVETMLTEAAETQPEFFRLWRDRLVATVEELRRRRSRLH